MDLKTKNVPTKSTSKEPVRFMMMKSSPRVNIFGEKRRKLVFLIVFSTYLLISISNNSLCRSTQKYTKWVLVGCNGCLHLTFE